MCGGGGGEGNMTRVGRRDWSEEERESEVGEGRDRKREGEQVSTVIHIHDRASRLLKLTIKDYHPPTSE